MRLSLGIAASLLALTASGATLDHRQSSNDTDYKVGFTPLKTQWTDTVGTNPWPEFPRPRLQRSAWKNLNGVWRYRNTDNTALSNPPFGQRLESPVLVPSCLESALSGVTGKNRTYSWYQTSFDIPSSWPSENKAILNFGAVDYEATVFVNGKNAGFHRGGYFEFSVDTTPYLKAGGANELLIHVYDPTDLGDIQIPIGKQTLNRGGMIWYTPCSGIWQTVFLESTPTEYIAKLDLVADMNGQVNVTVHSSTNSSSSYEITIHEQNSEDTKATATGSSGAPFTFKVDSPRLWTPTEPNLYNITIKFGSDTVQSYTGFRTISRGVINGIQRPLLNGDFIFPFGVLDQGFWPDGIYTPPSVEAMRYDLQVLKRYGFNALRKHIKVEPALFYRACDEIGLLVIQDMPSLRPDLPDPNNQCGSIRLNPAAQPEFDRQLGLLIEQLKNYPSIFAWTIYNEEWGQGTSAPWPEFRLTDYVRSLDPTRLINAVSGWTDHTAGDFDDNHHYSTPQCGTPFWSKQGPGADSAYDARRIGLQGEFGGIGQYVDFEHSWYKDLDHQTSYELTNSTWAWNYRCQDLMRQLREQVELFSCSGGVWTQTTDVEGEVNGMMTYDRAIIRMNETMWKEETTKLYEAAARRANESSIAVRGMGLEGVQYGMP
ncbi:glycoside hydrolase family 2 protein [Cucurbitaria berberidis CBS 394.84]|uniref:Glycoside hydrolase family 2 protein n=1 Tax=Cucurbitaria berberidis CBS 394.84 TaxID=1168544 RepID=A0A9P4GP52_9PLEO|nr:glycoside hydrolase family 2 protein [Cucurbitaria berberidis CBS 394.84]KAF1848851.1 glycoside hydrolase family 2 protein [Cucurbitaria berberidis CBS 394.84]